MKRKIIKQGHNTLTVTLPADWANRMKLGAGDEIDLSEKGNSLSLTTEKKDESKSAEIDINGMDILTMWKYFMAVYREGYDEVIVRFEPDSVYESPYKYYTQHSFDPKYEKVKLSHFELISEFARRFIGFEIVEHKRNYCILRDMGKISPKEFDSSLRRIFLLIQEMGEELMNSITKNNVKILMRTHEIDVSVDKFHDYTIRVMNKTLCVPEKKVPLIFATLYLLELLGDEFKNTTKHIIMEEKDVHLENLKSLTSMVVQQFNSFYDVYYKFAKEKVVEMSARDKEVNDYLPDLYKKRGGKTGLTSSELEIFNHLRRITRYIHALVELRTQIEYCKD
jgi:phosphate uptake regulator